MVSIDWQSQIFEKKKKRKKNGGLNLGPTGLNQTQNQVFRHFLEFVSVVFQLKLHTMIACNNI